MRDRARMWRTLFAAAALLALLPALAQAARDEVAIAGSGGDAVVWQPQIAGYDRLVLIVAGPGGTTRQEFPAGETPAFSLFDAAGDHVADGVYKWELRVVPLVDAATRRAMQAEREAGTNRVVEGLRTSGATPPATYQSGAFSVVGGAAVMPGDVEEGAGGVRSLAAPITSTHAEVVLTNANGVIRNALCVGLDCPDLPAFGDSSVLMMENNNRIKFGDTSAAGFPANDWEIEANSASAGGLNYLGFNDCGAADDDGGCATDLVFAVEAGARQNALYVESDGDVGIGTNNPVLDLHVVTGNTPALRLEQDGSSGFTAQTWDVAGNEASFFIRDVTGGSTLPFRIQPGAASNSLVVASDDEVGVGTLSPEAPLEVENGATGLTLLLDAPGDVFFRQRNTVSGQFVDINLIGNDFRLNFNTGGGGPELILTNNGDLTVTGDVFSATCTAPGNPCAPDYVFEPGYPLMDLDRLGEFVAENRHLPQVPSADQFEQQGRINLGQFQMTLLQKVEELTLYTLQQHETIAAQHASLAEQQASIAEQQASIAELKAQVAELKAALSAD